MNSLLIEIDALKTRLGTLRPLPPEASRKIDEAIAVEYTFESNRIEGNTLTLRETAMVVDKGLTIDGHPLREHLEAINHAEAVHFIRDIASGDLPVTENLIRDIHRIVLQGIDSGHAGRYRGVQVRISGSQHMPPQPYLINLQMEAFMIEYRRLESEGTHPVLIAAWLHYELVRIHPFIDGNGRTSRLLMNLYLLRHGYPIVMLKGDSLSRQRYYDALEAADASQQRAFNELIVGAVRDSLENYLSIMDHE